MYAEVKPQIARPLVAAMDVWTLREQPYCREPLPRAGTVLPDDGKIWFAKTSAVSAEQLLPGEFGEAFAALKRDVTGLPGLTDAQVIDARPEVGSLLSEISARCHVISDADYFDDTVPFDYRFVVSAILHDVNKQIAAAVMGMETVRLLRDKEMPSDHYFCVVMRSFDQA